MIGVDRFTTSAQETAQRSAGIMQRYGHHQIDMEHLLLALLEQPQGSISQLLKFLQVDPTALSFKLDALLRTAPRATSLRSDQGSSPTHRAWRAFSSWPMRTPGG